jgi:hypothetical protein
MRSGKRIATHALAVAISMLLLFCAAQAELLPEDLAAEIGPIALEFGGSGQGTSQQPSHHPLEHEVLQAAQAHGLPTEFFKNLIWQESRFKPYAISRAGAQGIAQFMPGTAQWRGLSDPFNAAEALQESARWLRELWAEFGNLGLAAAAYNAGPGRVSRWLTGRSDLPTLGWLHPRGGDRAGVSDHSTAPHAYRHANQSISGFKA